MRNTKLVLIFILSFLALGLMAQNANVTFKDATNTTLNLVRLESPTYPVATPVGSRWVVRAYLSSDNVVDPLSTTGQPTVNDTYLMDISGGLIFGPGIGALNIGAAVVPSLSIPTYLYLRIFNATTIEAATKYMTFSTAYNVAASGPVNVTIIPTYGWATPSWTPINPVQPTYTVNMTTNPAGNITPSTLGPVTDVTTIYGTYTPTPLAAPATGFWTPASLTIDAATVWTADGINWVLNQEFVWTETNTYNYTLNVAGPTPYTVTGPAGTMALPAQFMAPDTDMENELLGVYTPSAAADGFHWEPASIDVTSGMFSTAKGAALGSRAGGSRAVFNYVASIAFNLVPNPTTTYTLTINGPGGTQVTGPNTVVYTLPIAPLTDSNDMVNDLAGAYTAGAAPLGYEWAVNPITPVFDANAATITFVLNEIEPVVGPSDESQMPAGYSTAAPAVGFYVVNAQGFHDLYIPRQVGETGAQAYYLGAWHSPDGTPDWTWLNVDFGAKAPVYVVVFGPTLPVELSSFSAILTAQNFVKLTWVTESETNMNGYNVYRNETADYAAATHIGYQASTNSSTQHVYSHTDNEVETNNTYYYWLECVDFNGTSTLYGPQYVTVVGNDTPNLPTVTTLNNAYPNPFKTSTTIAVDVKEGENATVTIYNILGQAVMTYRVPAGTHNLNWNGRDSKGNACGSGIYFYKLTSPTMNQTKKMVIVK